MGASSRVRANHWVCAILLSCWKQKEWWARHLSWMEREMTWYTPDIYHVLLKWFYVLYKKINHTLVPHLMMNAHQHYGTWKMSYSLWVVFLKRQYVNVQYEWRNNVKLSHIYKRVCCVYKNAHFLCRLLNPAPILVQPVRTRILFSYRGGKPRTVRAVVHRFFRLYNGLWIRARAGRHKKRWMKPLRRVQQLKQHVFVNRTQCRLLDRMVNKFYKTPKYYVDDPYAPYHRKSNLPDYRYEPPKFYPWYQPFSIMQHLFTVLTLSNLSACFQDEELK